MGTLASSPQTTSNYSNEQRYSPLDKTLQSCASALCNCLAQMFTATVDS